MPLCGRKSPDSIRRTELGRMGGRRNRYYMDTEPIYNHPAVDAGRRQERASPGHGRCARQEVGAEDRNCSLTCPAFFWTPSQLRTCKSSWNAFGRKCERRRTSRDWQASRQATQLGHGPLAQLAQSASSRRSSVLSSRFMSIKRQWVLLCSD
jgi:hypothetical protein